MGKRNSGKFQRRARDYYKTPPDAVVVLEKYITHRYDGRPFFYAEPMVGDGAIIKAMNELRGEKATCVWASDIEPQMDGAAVRDVMDVDALNLLTADMVISNPPYPRPGGRGDPTVKIIEHLSSLKTTLLLLPADFMHNSYSDNVMARCRSIVSVGRISWEQNGVGGYENYAWYHFDDQTDRERGPRFTHRAWM